MAKAARRWGLNLGVLFAWGAAQGADRVALVDDEGTLTYGEMDARSDTVAAALAEMGVGTAPVAVLARNGRGFLVALVALGKLGADTVHCNTGFSGPQLRQVLAHEGVATLIADAEFLPLVGDAPVQVVLTGEPVAPATASFGAMLAGGPRNGPHRPGRAGRQVILTSGTTGAPKGAQRNLGADMGPLVALLSCIPLRTGDTTVVAAPMFHSWGLANSGTGLLFGMRLVTSGRFDPEHTLELIAAHRARVLIAVPAMIQRIMELPTALRLRHDCSSLRVVALSGSSIPGDLAQRFMDEFGEVVYNLYGSTEVGWISIATPADLRAAPRCAGRVPPGTSVRLLDERGQEVAAGDTGRIFVRSGLLFDGYTGGDTKTVIDGYMSTGDLGHFAGRRLFVDGRDDEMIVSGGENVFPIEIEDLLSTQPGVAEVAVIGVDDRAFGQSLHAFVVPLEGSDLDPRALLDVVGHQLARYKVPRALTFVDQLPRTATGKVRKAELHVLAGSKGRASSRGRAAGLR